MTPSPRPATLAYPGPLRGRRLPLLGLLVCGAAVMACQRPRSGEASGVVREALPVITRVVPETVTIVDGSGADLVIHGAGFDGDSNTVLVGPLSLHPLRSSANGTMISLRLPDRVPRSGGAAPSLWMSGPHDVQVQSPRGRSTVVSILVRGGT